MPPASRGSRRDFAALEARRYEAARLFARGESQATVARTLGATRAAAHRWYHAWQDKGRTALKAAGRAGRKPRLGWSLQRPTRQARERDEAAIAEWKRRRWPQVKKTPGGGGPGSSSKTKAASRTGRSSAAPGPRAATRRS